MDKESLNQIAAKLDHPIVMVGMMASGKSHLGRLLAETLDFRFVDLDKQIEAAAGASVARIFEREGEQSFRDREAKMLASTLGGSSGPFVVSTGGGAILRPESADLIFNTTITFWLRASPEIILARASKRNDRPLLQNVDQKATLEKMVKARYSIYERATFTIETDHGDAGRALEEILQKLKSI